jgi:hypothetical protein
MTDITQTTIEFARKCLGWQKVELRNGRVIRNALGSDASFDPASWESMWPYVRDFLGNKFWVRMNRDRMTNARWRIAIGIQDVAVRGASRESVAVIDDDQTRAIMQACVLAADELKLGGA